MFRNMIKCVVLFAGLVAVLQVSTGANGVAIPGGSKSGAKTPEEMAADSYNSGIAHRDRGLKAEAQALKEKKEADRAKAEKNARESYEFAIRDFIRASMLNPKMPQVYNGMGFSYRKLGDYGKALENYDRALELNPKFLDAIEYRGEAYLGLNRFDDAKQAYLMLFGADRKQADALMKAMKDFVAKKKVDPSGTDPAALAALESWINERSGVAEQTKPMALNHQGTAWR